MIRGDISNRVIHLTRGNSEMSAEQVFGCIVNEGKLRGSALDIRGGYSCVCFTEAPLTSLAQVMAATPATMRYQPFGVMVSKDWLYARGGRPVIYGERDEFMALPEGMRYRHVLYQPDKEVDWTWEREWRIQTNALDLPAEETTLVVPRRVIAEAFRSEKADANRVVSIALPEVASYFTEPLKWHFVALEDLGINFPSSPAA
jgi:hypothetical protein